MADKTFRELAADNNPALTKLVALQAATGSSEPTKTTLAELISVLAGQLAAVASSGDYADLLNKPILGALAALNSISTANVGDDQITFAKLQELSANVVIGAVTAGNPVELTCTAAGRALIDDADATAQRTTLGLGTIATQSAAAVTLTGGSATDVLFLQTDIQKTASFTFALTDADNIIEANHATVAIVGTIPTNATVAFPVGTTLIMYRNGAAAASFAAATGVTINKPADRSLAARLRYSTIAVRKVATNTWLASGDLAAA